jgi:tRNA (mo5U34)-methyltransferase
MRTMPPEGFDIVELNSTFNFFQRWEVFPGHFTIGPKDVSRTCDLLNLPKDLAGATVLDIGPWNGAFSFEAVRRGAQHVTAIGPEDPDITGFADLTRVLELDNITYIRDSLYNIPKMNIQPVDIVLFLGVIYHLRNPLLALDIIHQVCHSMLYVDAPIIDYGLHIQREGDFARLSDLSDVPLVYFSNCDEIARGKDQSNWFKPNRAALRDWVASSGFEVVHQDHTPDWGYVAARRGRREFQVEFEGFNPGAAYVTQSG